MTDLETIDSLTGLDDLLAGSAEVPVWLFKHSLTCGVSDVALRELLRFAEDRPPDRRERFGIVEIQPCREVSAAVSERTGVRHESPQLLLIRRGEVVWHASHWRIDGRGLAAAEARLEAVRGAGAPA